jgi:hypothetical protein
VRTILYCFWVDGIGVASTLLAIETEATAISALSNAAGTPPAAFGIDAQFRANVRISWFI